MAMTKVKNLQLWCKKMADGYRDVEVRDMASSWKSGLAFCAIIHRFRPDLIDYDSLSKENVFENNNLAFEVAEKKLSIPAFLEAEDMVAIRVPDKLSIVTYVSQYYNYFHNKPQLGGPDVSEFKKGGKKKDNVISPDAKTLTPTQTNTGKAATQKDRQESMGDKCTICHEKVYLLERHIENAKLYHRSCYRRSELSPQSRLSKRQQYRSVDEEKDTNKFRKIDSDKSESKSKAPDSGQDFWQRRAQAKAKEMSSQNQSSVSVSKMDETPSWKKSEPASQNQSSVLVSKMDDTRSWKKSEPASQNQKTIEVNRTANVPSWKKTEPTASLQDKSANTSSNDIVMGSSKVTTHDKRADFFNQNKQAESGSRPNRLADKFKELNDRYLNASQTDQSVGKSNENKGTSNITGTSNLVKQEPPTEKRSITDNEIKSPVAKPRTNILRKEEKMDTAEQTRVTTPQPTTPQPRPVPRFKVQIKPKSDPEKTFQKSEDTKKETLSSKILPAKDNEKSLLEKEKEIRKPKTPPYRHKEFSRPKSPQQRPKSPQQSPKSEFQLKPSSHNKGDGDASQSTPPPLPSSIPPKLPTSSPPHLKQTERNTPLPSPRQPVKTVKNEKNITDKLSPRDPHKHTNYQVGTKTSDVAPSKPPRISTNLNDTNKARDIHPMETDTFTPAKAISHEPSNQHQAFLTEPKKHNIGEEKKNREVFGGLLKSLADVRNKHVSEPEKSVSDSDKQYGASHTKNFNVNADNAKVEFKIKTGKDDHLVKPSSKTPPRPKSSFVSGRSEMFLKDDKNESPKDLKKRSQDNKPNDHKVDFKSKVTEKTTVTTKTVTTDVNKETVEWKKQLDKRKAESRPKSVDVLSNKSDQSQNSVDVLSNKTENTSKPDWQKEAERRRVARNGVYTDPEKAKVDEMLKKPDKVPAKVPVSDNNIIVLKPATRPVSPYQKKATDAVDKHVVFADNDKTETTVPHKEKRRLLPVPPQDKSPPKQQEEKKKITVGTKFVFDEVEVETVPKNPQRQMGSPKSPGPPRPPQPVIAKPSKHHMSAYQIQKELEKIDSKLTELELKGRGLEDAIRNAKEEEEDDLMIDWFKLVSNKNELVRQEADIIYVSRQQELETEHKAVEQQLRELVEKPDLDKSLEDKNEEEYLMQRLLDLVNQRSNIVDSIDEDRIRYIAEDKDIEQMLKDKVSDWKVKEAFPDIAFKLPPPKKTKKGKAKGKHLGLGFSKDQKDGKLKKEKKKSKLL